jgi:sporulation protein YlmC with PRC-barrel domain
LVLAAMVLAACGGEETATNLPSTQVPPITGEATMTEPATGAPTEMPTGEATGTPGVPVTGELNPARLSNQLDFTVWSQDGEQIGEVDDMVLDLDNTSVAYVVVGTGGFLDLGEREILVPWDSLQLQTGTGQGTGAGQATEPAATSGAGTGAGQATEPAATSGAGTDTGQATATAGTGMGDTTGMPQNAFVLQGDVEMFRNAPDFDLTNLPQMGQPAGDWDADIRSYWQGGGTGQATEPAATSGAGTGQATATAGTGGTGLATATAGAGTGAGQATATSGTGTGTGQGTATAGAGTSEGTTTLQGVVLASEILGSTVNLSAAGTGTGAGQATEPAATNGAGTGQATATAGTGGTGTGQATQGAGGTGQATQGAGTGTGQGTAAPGTGTDQGLTTATIEDMITDIDTGDILYVVLNAAFADADRWIPVPLGMFQFDTAGQGLVFSGDTTMLQGAPFFEDGQFPDTNTSGWNSEFDTFWQNSGAGGSGTGSGSGGAEATATP